MLTPPPGRRLVQGASFALWALAAASAVYWGFRLAAPPPVAQAPLAASRAQPVPDPVAIARFMGASPVAAAPGLAVVNPASRFSLVGVVARASRAGIALISVDGKPAKPYRVGATVDEGLVLQSVESRRVALGPSASGPAVVTLELPLARR